MEIDGKYLENLVIYGKYPLVILCSLLLKMTIEIVRFHMKNGDVP